MQGRKRWIGSSRFSATFASAAGLKEKSRGPFYRCSRGFLHFHEHGPDVFADVRFTEDFELLPATTAKDQKTLLRKVDVALGPKHP